VYTTHPTPPRGYTGLLTKKLSSFQFVCLASDKPLALILLVSSTASFKSLSSVVREGPAVADPLPAAMLGGRV